MDIDYRESCLHPAERCVLCHLQNDVHSHATDVKSHRKHQDKKSSNMKTSACATAICKSTSGRPPTPMSGQPDDAETCVLASALRPKCSAAKQFPFYHAAVWQTKVRFFNRCDLALMFSANSAARSPIVSYPLTLFGVGSNKRLMYCGEMRCAMTPPGALLCRK